MDMTKCVLYQVLHNYIFKVKTIFIFTAISIVNFPVGGNLSSKTQSSWQCVKLTRSVPLNVLYQSLTHARSQWLKTLVAEVA